MEKEITNCEECLFRYKSIDYETCGKDTLEFCILSMNLNMASEYIIDCYDSGDVENEIYKANYNIPTWCPLRNNPLTLKLKENVTNN